MAEKTKSTPVAVLKRLGTQAPEFALTCTLQKLDGTPVQLTLQCKALRKTVWAGMKDEHQRAALEAITDLVKPAADPQPAPADAKTAARRTKASKAAQAAPADAADAITDILRQHGAEATIRRGLESDAAMILQFATGWELEDPFTKANLQALEDEFGGALRTILDDYDMAIFQGRLGNSAR